MKTYGYLMSVFNRSRFIKSLMLLCILMPAPLFAKDKKTFKSDGQTAIPYDEGDYVQGNSDAVAPVPYKATPVIADDPATEHDQQLRKARQDELTALKQQEERAAQAADLEMQLNKKKYEFEKELALTKKKLFEAVNKQDRYNEEVEHMKLEISEMDGRIELLKKDLDSAESRSKIHEEKFSTAKSELDNKKESLKSALANTQKARTEIAKKINGYQIDVQKMRAEIATNQTEIAHAENERAHAEAEELQVRSRWSEMTAQAQAFREDKQRAQLELVDIKRRLEVARKEYQSTKSDWEKAEKEKLQAEQLASKQRSEINAEMRRLETETANAYNLKSNADAEKIRLSAEIDKLKSDLVYVKNRNATALSEASDAQGSIMESRLALETVKSELTNELASGESARLHNDSVSIKLRGLASAAENSDMVDSHKPWVVNKTCHIRRAPSSYRQDDAEVHAGDRLIAAPSTGGYVKILNSTGGAAFIRAIKVYQAYL